MRYDINGSFSRINDVRDTIDERDSEEESGGLDGVEFTKSFDDVEFSLRYDVEDGVWFGEWPGVDFGRGW